MATLRIYRSSAGAGKTHTLVGAYLEQALKSPEAFMQILAVTFTNQATQEMKQRILIYLHHLTKSTSSPIAESLMKRTSWDAKTLQTRAREVLSRILHQYTRFSVSTIDSFFQKVIRGFAQELGLQSGFRIELDQGYVLSKLIGELIDTSDQDLQLQQWLVAFSEDKLLSGRHWNFQRELMTLGQEIFSENFGQHESQLVATTSNHASLREFVNQLHRQVAAFEHKLQDWGKQALTAIKRAGLTVSDFAYGANGVAGYLDSLANKRRWQPSNRALKALQSVEAWYSKSSTQKEKIVPLVQRELMPCLQQATQFYDAHHRPYYTTREIQHFIYAFGIVTRLLEKLTDYRATHNVMLIADTSLFLRKIIAENDTPFVYEKIGAFYKHFLIDEFQDISGFQWNNLKPLVKNSLDEGHDSLVVGDAKQSIYRWRGGDWSLLHKHLKESVSQTDTIALDENWRSKEHIIAFNNTFFATAAAQLTQHLTSDLTALANESLKKTLNAQLQQLKAIYQDVHQRIPPQRQSTDKGYINITFLEDITDSSFQSWRETALSKIPNLVETLQGEGFALKDIALLVRNNAEARSIFQTLIAHQQSPQAQSNCRYDVISAESLYLGHNPWINLLVSALRCLIDAENALAQTELHYLYQMHSNSKGTSTKQVSNTLIEQLNNQRAQLLQLSLYELVETLIDLLDLHHPSAMPFLQAFKDVVLDFSVKELATVSNFIAWWQERGGRCTLPRVEGQDAMTLMTVHQSKGLQFKVVIVPFCAWDLDHNPHKPPTLWCAAGTAPFDQFPVLPIRYSGRLKDTVYAQAYYEERMQAYLDHLNLLYVAFTRPEDRLYVLAQRSSKTALKTTADLLYQTITRSASSENSPWKHNWDDKAGVLEIGHKVTQAFISSPSFSFKDTTKHQQYQTSSSHVNTWECLGAHSIQANYGKMAHRLLAQIMYLEDLPTVLATFQVEVGMTNTEITKLKQQLTALFKHPQVKDWFSSSWQVKNEAAILVPSGQVLRPDRVLIKQDQTVVLDFKTGKQQKHHAQQVRDYVHLLNDMGYTQTKGYLLYLDEGVVISVNGGNA